MVRKFKVVIIVAIIRVALDDARIATTKTIRALAIHPFDVLEVKKSISDLIEKFRTHLKGIYKRWYLIYQR